MCNQYDECCDEIKQKVNFIFYLFLQIPSTTMKEEEIDTGESRGGERFVTHVDLTQTCPLLVSITLFNVPASQQRAREFSHIKCDFEFESKSESVANSLRLSFEYEKKIMKIMIT